MQDVEWVEDRLRQVADILPDLSGRLDTMKADIVIQLVSDVPVRCSPELLGIAQHITGLDLRHLDLCWKVAVTSMAQLQALFACMHAGSSSKAS